MNINIPNLDIDSFLFNIINNNNSIITDILNNTDEPAQFIATLNSLLRALQDNNYTFNTPICFDATCSGMQHLSALFQDRDLAKMSNVISSKDNLPKDVYGEVVETVREQIKKIKNKEIKFILSKIKIDRKLLKRPVMTVPYNVSLYSLKDQLIEDGFFTLQFECLTNHNKYIPCFKVNPKYVDSKDKNLILNLEQMNILSSILYNSVYIRIPSLKYYIQYLES